jgi:ABC-type transport system involved in multi-copper enzyme maturation permease subunit
MTTRETAVPKPSAAPRPWALWRRQIAAILRLEARKSFLGQRALLLYLLALLPVAGAALFAVVALFVEDRNESINWASGVYAGFFHGLVMRTVTYFGCVWVFTNLFRGEVLDKSLHYYLLSPVRRHVLVAGKFLSGLLASVVLFGGSTAVSYLVFRLPFGAEAIRQHLFEGPGLGHLAAYVGITALACLGYGSIFLLLGLYLKNPILPAAIIYFWEWLNFLLPALLKKLSVVHYLWSLLPVPTAEGAFSLPVDPTPAWIAILGLLVLSAVMLLLSGWRIQRMEIDYGED